MLKQGGLDYSTISDQLRQGKPVLIFDDAKREGETDMIYPSEYITSKSILDLRKNAGGLICTTLRKEDADFLNLPFLEELYERFLPYGKEATNTSDMKYDSHSSFSFTINHRKTYTGITDNDRSSTVRNFISFLKKSGEMINPLTEFYKEFRIPGHVHLLIARDGYFSNRKGHTELATYLLDRLGFFPSATLAEMLSDSGSAMDYDEARSYADKNGLMFIEGKSIIDEWMDE